jgi:hypothetical protein
MKSLVSRPAFWLVLLIAFSFANAFAAHRFQSVRERDSVTYEDFDWSSLPSVLSSNRTPGYPLFLWAVKRVSSQSYAVPVAHWLMLIAASLVFYRGLTLAGYCQHSALFAAGAVMLSRGVLKFGEIITADSLAISLSIASAGCFFGTLSSRPRPGAWIGLTLFTFLTYLTRPAYLFLIPLWPLLGLVFDRLIVRRNNTFGASLRRAALYALATCVPFVAYCTPRLAVVGHFGLVSFGGYNFIGVVGQFLEDDDIDRLSPPSQELAAEMLELRSQLPDWEPASDMLAMERMFNPTVWGTAVPAAEQLHGEDPVAMNAALSQLGKELFWLHRDQYVRWLIWNAWHAVGQIGQLTALDRATLVLLLLLLVRHAVALWRGPKGEVVPKQQQQFLEAHLLCWTAIAFACAGAFLVILVEPANDRYMTGAMTLLPAALAVIAAPWLRLK